MRLITQQNSKLSCKKFLLENSFYSLEEFYNFALGFILILYFIDLVFNYFHLL
jgi:hypothetical protein